VLENLREASYDDDIVSDLCALRRLHVELDCPSIGSSGISPRSPLAANTILEIPLDDLEWNNQEEKAGAIRHRVIYMKAIPGTRYLNELNALVEWKSYRNDADEKYQEQLAQRLATLLSFSSTTKGLRVPKCYGYVSDHVNFRIGLVYAYGDQSEPQSIDLLSLHEILGKKGVPSLGDRFKLALNLATSISVLHTSGWLHKQLNSDNVVFFTPPTINQNSGAPTLGNLYIVGFDSSRPDENEAISELVTSSLEKDLYRHPDSQGVRRKRFCPLFDIYSLGVMLMEIGYCRRISEFHRQGSHPEAFQQDLLKFHSPRLVSKTGSIYASVVQNCLGGLADIGDGNDGIALDNAELQRRFYWLIVNELSRLVV
jgi:hypothetical protein